MGKETWEDECVFILFFSVTVKALRSQTTKVAKHDKIIKKKKQGPEYMIQFRSKLNLDKVSLTKINYSCVAKGLTNG